MPPDQAAHPPATGPQHAPADAAPAVPRRSYLQGVLAHGAQPFVYRGRIRSLLGLPENDGVNLSFVATGLLPGLTYTRPRAVAFYEQPADLLTSLAGDLVEAEDFAAANQAIRPDVLPDAPITPPPAPPQTAAANETPQSAARATAAAPHQAARSTDTPRPADASAPLTLPPLTVDAPAPPITRLAIPDAPRAIRPAAPPPPPLTPRQVEPDALRAGPITAPPARRAPAQQAAPPFTGRGEAGDTQPAVGRPERPGAGPLEGGRPADARLANSPVRWQPVQAAAQVAALPYRRPPEAGAADTFAAEQPPAVVETVHARRGPAPERPNAGPAGLPPALPYLTPGGQGASRAGEQSRQTRPNSRPPADDDWPAVTRPAPPPAPQVVVIHAPTGAAWPATPAFWERSHLGRLRTRIVR